MTEGFSHLSEEGNVRMVDVGSKPPTERVATAESRLTMAADVLERLFAGSLPKGDALATVRVAAIMAVKRTPDLIPLCHPIAVTGVDVLVEREATGARIEVSVRTVGSTGVEMEAMTGASVGALALYDMIKGLDRSARVSEVRLLAKSGGASGTWRVDQ